MTLGWMKAVLVIGAMVFLAACSSGSGGGGETTPVAAPSSGTFVDSLVQGLGYKSLPSGLAGKTDATGQYQYVPGDVVTFDIGGRVIGTVSGGPQVTALSVFGATSIADPRVVNLSQLLLTLGGIPTGQNPIQLPATIPGSLPNPLNFSDPNFTSTLQNALPGTTVVTHAQATTHLQTSFKTLSVTVVNNGTVTSIPAGINCIAGTCSYDFVTDTAVTLTEMSTGFTGWSGDCQATGLCNVTMNVTHAVTATFAIAPPPATLTILPNQGTGTGSVACSANGGVFDECAASYASDTELVLQATANNGSTFGGWVDGTGNATGCNGTTSNCSMHLTADSAVRGNFVLNTATFSLTTNKNSTTSGGGTIACSTTGGAPFGACAPSFNAGTTLALQATPNNASNFTGWGNGSGSGNGSPSACNNTTGICNFTITSNSSITANFNRPTLTVIVSGPGSVSSNPNGINNCTTTCATVFDKGTSVTLTAGAGLTGWSDGGCSGTGNCVVILSNDTTVTGNFTPSPPPVAGVFTYHNDNARTGQSLNESVLTPTNVNATTFGLLFSVPVDGQIYAQPLYVAGLNIGGRLRNVVFVATEHDSVYAFDADNPTSTPLWHTSFINPAAGITTVASADLGCTDLIPEIGITSTPVIDPSSGTLYVESKTKENGTYVHRIHALELTTGREKISSVIQGGVPGIGDGTVNGIVSFDPYTQLQRPALLLSNDLIYVAFASHCDGNPYHGWVFAYDAQTLSQRAIFNSTPNGGRGGIWHGGGGPAADASGNVFVITGNGTFDGPSPAGSNNFGDTFLKLTSGGLALADFFTPFNQATLDAFDADLGSGAPLLLPDQSAGPPHLLVSAGKAGTIYLLDRDNMGKFQPGSDSQIVQSLPSAQGAFFGTPAYFQNTVYFLAAKDSLKAFSLNSGHLGTSPASQSTANFGFPGATPVISANGAANAIVWALQTDQFGTKGPAVLHAYLASNVSTELYNSNQNPSRDNPGPAVKFTVPTVFNGKVYVGTQTQLSVFGLLP